MGSQPGNPGGGGDKPPGKWKFVKVFNLTAEQLDQQFTALTNKGYTLSGMNDTYAAFYKYLTGDHDDD